MRNTRLSLLTLIALCAGGSAVFAQSATQTVSYDVQPISVLSMPGGPVAVAAGPAVAGNATRFGAGSVTVLYNITNNQLNRKIVAQLDSNMPAGAVLYVKLDPTTGSTNPGYLVVNGSPVDTLTGINAVSEAHQAHYFMDVVSTTAAQAFSRVVTYTIAQGS